MEALRFALLGLGTGGVYALAAQGVVLAFRGSGVINFAHTATGMIVAFAFYEVLEAGWTVPAACGVAFILATAAGALQYWFIQRPLADASPLARLVATLATLALLQAAGVWFWGYDGRFVDPLLPNDPVTPFSGATMGVDRFILLGIALCVTGALAWGFHRTRLGLQTAAVAESRTTAAVHGVAPDHVAAINWILSSWLAATACVLVAPITGLGVLSLSLLVIPAIAAALLGGFRSFLLTGAAAICMGVAESELTRFVRTPGVPKAVPLVVIVAVLVLRRPEVEHRSRRQARPPHLGTGRVRSIPVALASLAAVVALNVLGADRTDPVATSLTAGLILLSLVTLTGFTGQISLAQYTLAGLGAWVASRSIVNYGWPVEVAVVAGVVATALLATLVGLTSLRSRGTGLAIATLALALALEATILTNSARTGGLNGTNIGRFEVLGVDLTGFSHPNRYAIACLVSFAAVAVAVANLRRSRTGLQLVAVRTNERAAASLGVRVAGAKLYAFALSGAIAGLGGVLIGFRNPSVTFAQFNVFQSVYGLTLAVTGGIGFVVGALVGSLGTAGGVIPSLVTGRGPSGEFLAVVLAAGGVFVVSREPDGVARRILGVVRNEPTPPEPDPADDVPYAPVLRPKRLQVTGLTVRYGGVIAVDSLDLEVRPGEILGLIGPNGAGKTTAIDAITGFVPGCLGTVHLADEQLHGFGPTKRARAGLARTFQSLELFDSLTVRDNLLVAAQLPRWWHPLTDLVRPGRPALDPHALGLVRDLGLVGDLDRTVEQLSLGRRRLVALARALVSRPSVLLLDEPAAGLDDHERAELRDVLRLVAHRWGCGILLVEHDVPLVFDVSDRIQVIDFGRALAAGSAADIRTHPAVQQAYLGTSAHAPTPRRRPAAGKGRPVLDITRLTVGYGTAPALRNLNLSLDAGEVCALVGPNGSGKTATILTTAGAQPALAGHVRIDSFGHPKSVHALVRNGVAIVLDDRSVLTDLSAAQNLHLAGIDPERALDLFPELAALLDRRAGDLSGGEQQMLSLGRALASKPSLLLIDELSLGLAPVVVERLYQAVHRAAEAGTAVLVVEQQANAVLEHADSVVVVAHGTVLHAGPVTDLDPEALNAAYFTTKPTPHDSPALARSGPLPEHRSTNA